MKRSRGILELLNTRLYLPFQEEPEEDEGPEPSTASKEVYTWIATLMKNFEETDLEFQDGGVMVLRPITEIDDKRAIAQALIEMLEKRFIGIPLPEDENRVFKSTKTRGSRRALEG